MFILIRSKNFLQNIFFIVLARRLTSGQFEYIYFFNRLTFTNALSTCRENGYTMLIINSPQIQATVERQLRFEIGVVDVTGWRPFIEHGYWIGGRDVIREGVWLWNDRSRIPTDATIPGYQNWYRFSGFNEPFPNNRSENCMFLNGVINAPFVRLFGSWLTSNCFLRKFFICQRSLGKKKTNFLFPSNKFIDRSCSALLMMH